MHALHMPYFPDECGAEHHGTDSEIHERDAGFFGLGKDSREHGEVHRKNAEANEAHDNCSK